MTSSGYRRVLPYRALLVSAVVLSQAGALRAQTAATTNAAPVIVKPTPAQVAWQDLELGMFIHWDVPWDHRDYEHKPKPDVFNPTKLNTDQWMAAARAFGAKYCVLTATHGTGFMLWQSEAYPFGMKQSPYKNGRCDVVKEYVASCHKAGIKPGLYCHMKVNGWWEVDHPGLVNRGKGGDAARQAEYAKAKLTHARELWGNYGPLVEIWFDGGLPDPKVAGFDVMPLALTLQPKAMIMGGSHSTPNQIRCVGNESGHAGYPCWATATFPADQNGGDPNGKDYLPAEADAPLTFSWQHSGSEMRSVEELMQRYYLSVGCNANLLLNAAIDPTGLIPEREMKRYVEFGREIQRRFGKSVAETTGQGHEVVLKLGPPAIINHVILMEKIAEGERIREYVVEGFAGGAWQELTKGACVGHKRIAQFADIEVSQVRLRVIQALAQPLIRKLAVYNVEKLSPEAAQAMRTR